MDVGEFGGECGLPTYGGSTLRRLEYWGGLGDIVNHVHWLPCYQALDTLGPSDRAKVVISSHNPHAKEIFLWHPKRAYIDLEDIGFHSCFRDPAWRKSIGLPEKHECDHGHPFTKTVFYPSPDDRVYMEQVRALGPYVLFSPSAGETQKTVPIQHVDDAVPRAARHGFTPVLVGRNYTHNYRSEPQPPGCAGRREIKPNAPVLDLVDKLTVPAVLELVRGASGVFGCHSAVALCGWHMNRPVFVLYDAYAKEHYFTKKKFEGYSFGAGRPEGDHMEFSEYRPERFERFLERLKKR
jgi:hypothetical protein